MLSLSLLSLIKGCHPGHRQSSSAHWPLTRVPCLGRVKIRWGTSGLTPGHPSLAKLTAAKPEASRACGRVHQAWVWGSADPCRCPAGRQHQPRRGQVPGAGSRQPRAAECPRHFPSPPRLSGASGHASSSRRRPTRQTTRVLRPPGSPGPTREPRPSCSGSCCRHPGVGHGGIHR